MRKGHIIGGLIVFSIGLFSAYLNSAIVVEFIKGIIQPIFIIIGLLALIGALLGKKNFRTINSIIAGIFLFLGLYGLYDEYYAVADFFSGSLPILLIIVGSISIVHGIRKLS